MTSIRATGCGEQRGDRFVEPVRGATRGAGRRGNGPTTSWEDPNSTHEGHGPRRHQRWHGQPGQRERHHRAMGRATGPGPALGEEVGQPAAEPGGGTVRRATGGGTERQRGRATGSPGHNGHRPPRLTARRAMCRSSGRLTPEDRPVVDHPNLRGAPGGCAGASRQHRPGLFTVFIRVRCAHLRAPRSMA